jgi:cell division protein FtsQ
MEINQPLRRTDEIRRKRMQQTREAKRIPDRRKRKVVSPTSPPVLVRNQMFGTALSESQTIRKSRRRYDVRLDAQGAEMRLPALPQVSVGWRFASFAVFALLIFVLYQFWSSPTYQVDIAKVEGLRNLNNSEINKVLGLTSEQVFALDADLMQQELLDNFPEFKAVSVAIDLPNTVVISVTERIPVLVWRQGERTLLLDAEGMAFQEREGTTLAMYPVIDAKGDAPLLLGNEPISGTLDSSVKELEVVSASEEDSQNIAKPLLSPEMVSAYLLLSQKLPKGAQLIYDPEHGIGWIDRREWSVYFGDEKDIETKLSMYNVMLEHIKIADVRPTLISVEYIHAPYYRLEP